MSVLTAVLTTSAIGTAATSTSEEAQVDPFQNAFDIGKEAYIWGYPLVTLKRTEAIALATQAPINQFSRAQNLATPASRLVVRPNNDNSWVLRIWITELYNVSRGLNEPGAMDRS